MKNHLLIAVVVGSVLLGGCSVASNQNSDNQVANQVAACSTIEVTDNLAAYTQLAVPEKQSVGVLEDSGPATGATILQRSSRYSLSGQALAPISQDLSAYVGKQVIVVGKQYKFELEGQLLDELWAKSISCR